MPMHIHSLQPLVYIGNITKWYFSQLRKMYTYSKTCVKRPLSKRPKIGFQDQLLLNAGQKY